MEVLKAKKREKKKNLKKKKGINTPNWKPELTGGDGANPARISGELSPPLLLHALRVASTLCEKDCSHTSINQNNSRLGTNMHL